MKVSGGMEGMDEEVMYTGLAGEGRRRRENMLGKDARVDYRECGYQLQGCIGMLW